MNDIQNLHSLYNQLTGFNLRLMGREQAWFLYLKAGFNAEDLIMVLNNLKYGTGKGFRFKGSMGFTRLIWGLDIFEEELALAKAYVRNSKPPQTNRQSVIRVFRPQASDSTGPTVSCKPSGAVVAKLIADLKKAVE